MCKDMKVFFANNNKFIIAFKFRQAVMRWEGSCSLHFLLSDDNRWVLPVHSVTSYVNITFNCRHETVGCISSGSTVQMVQMHIYFFLSLTSFTYFLYV